MPHDEVILEKIKIVRNFNHLILLIIIFIKIVKKIFTKYWFFPLFESFYVEKMITWLLLRNKMMILDRSLYCVSVGEGDLSEIFPRLVPNLNLSFVTVISETVERSSNYLNIPWMEVAVGQFWHLLLDKSVASSSLRCELVTCLGISDSSAKHLFYLFIYLNVGLFI